MPIRYVGGFDTRQVPRPYMASVPYTGFVTDDKNPSYIDGRWYYNSTYESVVGAVTNDGDGQPASVVVGARNRNGIASLLAYRVFIYAKRTTGLFQLAYQTFPATSQVEYAQEIQLSEQPDADVLIRWQTQYSPGSTYWRTEAEYQIHVTGENIITEAAYGSILDLGDNYFGLCVGGEYEGTEVPLVVYLYQLRSSGDPTFIKTITHSMPLPMPTSSPVHKIDTTIYSNVPAGPNRCVGISANGSGGAPFAIVIERQGEDLLFGPPYFFGDDTYPYDNNILDETTVATFPDPWGDDYGAPGWVAGWCGGSFFGLSVDSSSFVVAANVQQYSDDAHWVLATRKLTVTGNTVSAATGWKFNLASSAAVIDHNEYPNIHGGGVYGNEGYIFMYDWAYSYGLHRIDLATADVTHSVPTISDPIKDSFDPASRGYYTGSMVATKDGVICLSFGVNDVGRLDVQLRSLADLSLVTEYLVLDETGNRLGVWHSWDVNDLPQMPIGNSLPIVTQDYNTGVPPNNAIVTLLGPNEMREQAEFVIPTDMIGWDIHLNTLHSNYMIASGDVDAWSTSQWDAVRYTHGIFQWTPPPVVARAGDGMLAQYFTGAR